MRTLTRTVLTSTETDFCLHATLDAYESDVRVAPHDWHLKVPRDHVSRACDASDTGRASADTIPPVSGGAGAGRSSATSTILILRSCEVRRKMAKRLLVVDLVERHQQADGLADLPVAA